MSVASKIKDAIAGMVPDADPETVTAIDRVHAAAALLTDLRAKEQTAIADLHQLERREGQEALAAEQGDRSRYEKYSAEVERAREVLRRLQAALREASRQEHEAKSQLHLLGKRGQIKTAKRLTKMRADAIADLAGAYEAEAKAQERLLEINDKIAFSWPDGAPPAGGLIGSTELMDAIAVERFRMLPRTPLQGHRPTLPGANNGTFLPAPKDIKSLAQAMDEANAYLLDLVEQGPVPAPQDTRHDPLPALDNEQSAPRPQAPIINANNIPLKTVHLTAGKGDRK